MELVMLVCRLKAEDRAEEWLKVEEAVQADGSSMEEESMAETEQGDAGSNGGESSMDMSNNNPPKRGRGRPQGSKKLKVCVTDVNLMELVSGMSNGGSTQPHRGRGRPRLSKQTEQQGSGDDTDNSVQTPRRPGRPKGSKNQASNKDTLMTDHSPKKRGRPKKSLDKSTHEKVDNEDLPNGGSDTPKPGRGRPKGSTKRKMESLTSGGENEGSSVTPRKRGRPKGSLNKTHRLEKEESSGGETDVDESLNSMKRGRGRLRKVEVNNTRESTQDTSNSISKVARRGRGRPRKNIEHSRDKQGLITDGSQPVKRGRGRPKGSLNKKPPAYKVHGKVGRPRRVHVPPARGKRGRPRKQPAKRGRPRKYPLPSPEELKKPKVWKPLGRPRKYPRVDPPEGVPPAPRRSRGRPRKSASKKGAHLRKSLPTTASSPRSDGSPRKRGRPPSTPKNEADTPRKKRGRPKGSVNKNKARSETQLDSSLSKSDLSAVEEEHEGESLEQKHETDTTTVEHQGDTEEVLEQEAGFERRRRKIEKRKKKRKKKKRKRRRKKKKRGGKKKKKRRRRRKKKKTKRKRRKKKEEEEMTKSAHLEPSTLPWSDKDKRPLTDSDNGVWSGKIVSEPEERDTGISGGSQDLSEEQSQAESDRKSKAKWRESMPEGERWRDDEIEVQRHDKGDGSLADDEEEEEEEEEGESHWISEKAALGFTPQVTIVRPSSKELPEESRLFIERD
ncbi:hypothetical protein D5F01_LYC19310 [Larimichthys crocea]|uniref:Uncharacterized protein n=1 Tax=Larimichthys crocea TaxID=215358 RepID=A0A6G0HSC8_LARCR|nr:hypothetical protein D5F01_LYC19310 [Larimichthys crocea]